METLHNKLKQTSYAVEGKKYSSWKKISHLSREKMFQSDADVIPLSMAIEV